MGRTRRLVFGEVADLYDEYRPSYPVLLVEDLIEIAALGGDRAVLEVGAGTGKATLMFAERGLPVTAVEPSAEMAAVARRACSAFPRVRIEEHDFEDWDATGQTFPLIFAAQSWHWIQTPVGFIKASRLLEPGGVLAAFWNRPVWPEAPARVALVRAYHQAAPGLDPADDPMHPENQFHDDDADWSEPVVETEGLDQPEVRSYASWHTYSTDAYVQLLRTHSATRIMPPEQRAALLDAITSAITAHGDTIALPMRTRLCIARRTNDVAQRHPRHR